MSGFTFGQTTQPQTTQVAPTFSLGTSAPGATGGSVFNFNTPSTTSLAATTASAFPAVATVTPFGQTTSTAPTATILPTLSTTVQTAFSLPTAATTTAGFSLPTAAAATTTTTSLFGGFPSLGATTTSAPSLFSGLGQPAASTALGFGLGSTAAAPAPTSTTSGVGLGGVDLSNTSLLPGTSLSLTGAKSDTKAALKENPLPDEILVCLEQFKKHVKEQKEVREAISRYSSGSIKRVSEEAGSLSQLLAGVTNSLHRHRLAIDRLKEDAAKELKNAEIAQRTKETPPVLQMENTAPVEYFHQLIDGFQLQMKEYQVQISQLEQLLVSSNTAPLAPQELTTLLHRLHETFVSIAARIHTIHETVQRHKENLTMYRRSGSVIYTKSHQLSAPLSTIGPSPFTAATNTYTLASSSQHFGGTPGSSLYGLPASQTFGGLTGSFTQPASSTLGPTAPLTVTTPTGEQKPFQLKPPPSNKRNKRWTSS